jgi:hypothetical protein
MEGMKTVHLQHELETAVDALFQRWPALLGFSVRGDGENYLAEVATHPWFNPGDAQKLQADLAGALGELLDEEPATLKLIEGRTFARVLH